MGVPTTILTVSFDAPSCLRAPNDEAHLPGPLQELGVTENQDGGPGQVQRLVRRDPLPAQFGLRGPHLLCHPPGSPCVWYLDLDAVRFQGGEQDRRRLYREGTEIDLHSTTIAPLDPERDLPRASQVAVLEPGRPDLQPRHLEQEEDDGGHRDDNPKKRPVPLLQRDEDA